MKPKFKNNLINLAFYSLFIVFCYHIIQFSLSFEMGYNEVRRIWKSSKPLLGHFYRNFSSQLPSPYPSPDHDFIVAALVKFLGNIFDEHIYLTRLVFVGFYLYAINFFYTTCFKEINNQTRLLAVIFLSLHTDLLYYSTAISPYSLNLLSVLFLYFSYLNFNNDRKSLILHSFSCLLSMMLFFTSALPSLITIYLLFKNYKLTVKKYFYFYIPFFAYLIGKGYLILSFRLFDRKIVENFSSTFNLKIKFLDYLDFFNINSINSEPILNTIVVVILIASTIYYMFFLFLHKTKINQLTLYFFISSIFIYFSLIIYGADEISPRYFIPLLPLFYISFSHFLLNSFFLRKNIINLFLIIFFTFISAYKYTNFIKGKLYVPHISAINSILKDLNKNDLICYNKSHENHRARVRRVSLTYLSGAYKEAFQYNELDEITSCLENLNNPNIKEKKNIYLINIQKPFGPESFCNNHRIKGCKDSSLYRELTSRNKKNVFLVQQKDRNSELSITKFSQENFR